MPFAYSLAVLTVLALLAVIIFGKGHLFARKLHALHSAELQNIDVDAFRNLVDENEEAYLREHLTTLEFRMVHRERMLAAVEYVKAAYGNAGILVRIAEGARESADPEVAASAAKLFENAVQLRWHAFQVIPKLYLKIVLPGASEAPRSLFDRYDLVTSQALVLGRVAATGKRA